MTDIVINRDIPDVITFSKPFSKFFGLLPLGGRSTAIRLSSSTIEPSSSAIELSSSKKHDVWVVASTPLSNETKAAIEELGTVKYILAANVDHHLYLADWKRNYPNAEMIGVETLAKKMGKDWTFDKTYESNPKNNNNFGFEDDIEAIYFSGFNKKDVAWFHKPSKSLIVADLIFNLPGEEQYSKSRRRKSGLLTKNLNPYTYFHKNFIMGETNDRDAMAEDAKAVAAWDFERIIPCHGDIIEANAEKTWTTDAERVRKTDAKKAWKTAYAKFLDTPDPAPVPAPAPTSAPTPAGFLSMPIPAPAPAPSKFPGMPVPALTPSSASTTP